MKTYQEKVEELTTLITEGSRDKVFSFLNGLSDSDPQGTFILIALKVSAENKNSDIFDPVLAQSIERKVFWEMGLNFCIIKNWPDKIPSILSSNDLSFKEKDYHLFRALETFFDNGILLNPINFKKHQGIVNLMTYVFQNKKELPCTFENLCSAMNNASINVLFDNVFDKMEATEQEEMLLLFKNIKQKPPLIQSRIEKRMIEQGLSQNAIKKFFNKALAKLGEKKQKNEPLNSSKPRPRKM